MMAKKRYAKDPLFQELMGLMVWAKAWDEHIYMRLLENELVSNAVSHPHRSTVNDYSAAIQAAYDTIREAADDVEDPELGVAVSR